MKRNLRGFRAPVGSSPSRERARDRLGRFLWLALGAHALVAAMAGRRGSPPAPPGDLTDVAAPPTLDVELEPSEGAPTRAPSDVVSPPEERSPAVAALGAVPRRADPGGAIPAGGEGLPGQSDGELRPAAPAGPAASAGGPAAEGAPGDDLGALLRPRLSLEALHVGGSGKDGWITPPPSASAERAELEREALRTTRTELYEADRKAGFGVGGPLAEALKDSAREHGPVEGTAVFVVTTNGQGDVESVVTVESSSERQRWDEVARRMAASFAKGRKRLRDRGRGVSVRIAIDVKDALPSGARPGAGLRILDQRVGGKDGRAGNIELLPVPKGSIVVEQPPNPDTASGVKTPTARAEIAVLRSSFDLADIGAEARRVVHARIVEEAAR